jgi:hypothetical protein
MYECTICLSLNHASRYHCQICGAIPAQYSMLGVPSLRHQYNGYEVENEVIAAHGCERQGARPTQRLRLQTVALDYYGEA